MKKRKEGGLEVFVETILEARSTRKKFFSKIK
jgi:hypothetical protein